MKKILILTAILLALTGLSTATNIEEENIVVDLEDNTVEAEIHFNDLTSSTFTYMTNHPVEDYEVYIESERVECEFQEMSLGGEIQCPTDVTGEFTVDLEYKTSGLVDSQNGVSIFRYSQSIYRPISEYNFKVILPQGAGIVDEENLSTPVISPENGEVGSEGRRIHVEWTENPSLGDTVSFEVTHENLSTEFRWLVVIATLIVLSAGFVRFYRKRDTENKDDAEVNSDKLEELTEDEKLVLDLVDIEGGMLQKDIVDKSDYSKAKISGVVSGLEDKEFIEKEAEGRSNRITVKEEFKK